jgi:putative ATP-binding cassette transporter
MRRLIRLGRATPGAWRSLLVLTTLSGLANVLLLVLVNRGIDQAITGGFNVQLIALYGLGFGIFVQAQYTAMTRGLATVEAAMQQLQCRLADRLRQAPWSVIAPVAREVASILPATVTAVAHGARLLITMIQSLLLLALASLYLLTLSPASLMLILLGYAALIPLAIASWTHTRRAWPIIDQTEADWLGQFNDLIAQRSMQARQPGDQEALFTTPFTTLGTTLGTTARTAYQQKCALNLRHMRDLLLRRFVSFGMLFAAVFIVPAITAEAPEMTLKMTTTVLFILAPLTVVLDLLPMLARVDLGLARLAELEARLERVGDAEVEVDK